MNKSNNTVTSKEGQSTLVSPKFGPGMLLQHEDLEQLNAYTRDLSRLMFRSFFGCGVVCGLVVKPEVDNCNRVFVTIGAGLALDCSGDPVYVPKDVRFALDENCNAELPDKLWVVLCGTVKACAPRTSMCASDDDEATSVCTRERDMFEIRVVSGSEPPKCACGCTKLEDPGYVLQDETKCQCADPNQICYKDHYLGKCGCNCGDGSNCDCKCILLARLDKIDDKEHPWRADHRVRRFIRPVLMRDPQVAIDEHARRSSDEEKYRKDLDRKAQDAGAPEQYRKDLDRKAPEAGAPEAAGEPAAKSLKEKKPAK
jgi:hypothetical protein